MGMIDNDRVFVTAGEIARNFGRWQDEAARAPVVVTHHGRQRVVLLSADTFDEMAAGSADPSEARLAALLGHSVEGFFALDGGMTIIAVNQVFQDYTGMTAGQMIGRPYAEVFPAAAMTLPGEHFRRVVRTGEPCQFELLSTVRAGAILDVRAFPYADGVGVLYVNRTEERAMAERLRGAGALEKALLAAGHAAIVELNVRGAIVAVSPALERMTGFDRTELMRHRLADLLAPRTRSGMLAALDAVLAGEGPASANAVVLGRDGIETLVALGISAIDDLDEQRGAKVVMLRA